MKEESKTKIKITIQSHKSNNEMLEETTTNCERKKLKQISTQNVSFNASKIGTRIASQTSSKNDSPLQTNTFSQEMKQFDDNLNQSPNRMKIENNLFLNEEKIDHVNNEETKKNETDLLINKAIQNKPKNIFYKNSKFNYLLNMADKNGTNYLNTKYTLLDICLKNSLNPISLNFLKMIKKWIQKSKRICLILKLNVCKVIRTSKELNQKQEIPNGKLQ